ncbi:hypothetical protein, partial [Paracraurococcus ruber]
GANGDQRMFWSSFDGQNWSPQQVGIGGGSASGPSLAVFQNRLYAAWSGANGDQRMFWSSFDVDRRTVVLRVNNWIADWKLRSFSDVPLIGTFTGRGIDCSRGFQLPPSAAMPTSGPNVVGDAGWGQVEINNSDSCQSWVRIFAFDFDVQPFKSIPGVKQIEKVELSYKEGETPLNSCHTLIWTQGGTFAENLRCWTNGQGDPEEKTEGCLYLRVPSVNWAVQPDRSLLDLAFHKVEVRGRWDVTDLFRRRVEPGLTPPPELGGPAPQGWGFALAGVFTDTSQLDARDNTRCTSRAGDIALEVSFVVVPPQSGGVPAPPR